MADLMDPRTWDDEDLERAMALGLHYLPDGESTRAVVAESARRAEIRLVRGEMGEMHDASWYQSRQTEEQWLAEMEA